MKDRRKIGCQRHRLNTREGAFQGFLPIWRLPRLNARMAMIYGVFSGDSQTSPNCPFLG